jgi:TldD protein
MRAFVDRRGFLGMTSCAIASAALQPTGLHAGTVITTVPRRFLREPIDRAKLDELAGHALDAARGAGAQYADVRVAEYHRLIVAKQLGIDFYVNLETTFSYGVRTRVGGIWASAHGTLPTTDSVTAAARRAVQRAKRLTSTVREPRELASTPVSTGEWSVPVTIDPFAVPLEEQMALLLAWDAIARRVQGGFSASLGLGWTDETRVVHTTDGTRVMQRFVRSRPNASVLADRMQGGTPVQLIVPSIKMQSGGYECVTGPGIQSDILATTEDALRYALLPGRALDVGRYPMILDGVTAGRIVGAAVGEGIEMDRVMGDEVDASGTSSFAPVSEKLGRRLVSPLLTIHADRSLPSVLGRRWDDEGVEVKNTTIIREGTVTDYQTTRDNARQLESWYLQHQLPTGSRGCAIAGEAHTPVTARCGHLTVVPGTRRASVDDLVRTVQRGILVSDAAWISTDQQGSTGMISSNSATFLEIERGRIVRRVMDGAVQFRTLPLLASVTAIGDPTTMRDMTMRSLKGMPWHVEISHVSAPAMAVSAADLISTGRVL